MQIINESNNHNLLKHISKVNNFKTTKLSYLDNHKLDNKFSKISDLKIGDTVEISFVPFSQKYLDYYENEKFRGRIFYINNEFDDMLLYYDNDDSKRIIKSVYVDGCSYGFDNSLGYFLSIKKLKKSKKRKIEN